MMHSRGVPGSMHEANLKTYNNLEVDIAWELQNSVDEAIAAGVRTWNIMMDPGIGFGKGVSDNFRLLTSVSHIRQKLRGADSMDLVCAFTGQSMNPGGKHGDRMTGRHVQPCMCNLFRGTRGLLERSIRAQHVVLYPATTIAFSFVSCIRGQSCPPCTNWCTVRLTI